MRRLARPAAPSPSARSCAPVHEPARRSEPARASKHCPSTLLSRHLSRHHISSALRYDDILKPLLLAVANGYHRPHAAPHYLCGGTGAAGRLPRRSLGGRCPGVTALGKTSRRWPRGSCPRSAGRPQLIFFMGFEREAAPMGRRRGTSGGAWGRGRCGESELATRGSRLLQGRKNNPNVWIP